MDADPIALKLYVQASPRYMAQVRAIIENLEGPAGGDGSSSTLRFIPMTGNSAVKAVEMAERLWRGPNQIRMTAPAETGPGTFELREISPDGPAAEPETPTETPRPPPASRRPDDRGRCRGGTPGGRTGTR